jgi:hypothetical protein
VDSSKPDSTRYTDLAEHLPSLYQEHEASWEQVRSYLSLLDQWSLKYLDQLEQALVWLSPTASEREAGSNADRETGRGRVRLSPTALERVAEVPGGFVANGESEKDKDRETRALFARLELCRQLASWFGLEFPPNWEEPLDADRHRELKRKVEFLRHVPRLWRRRGTPQGFVQWFCLYFDVPSDHRPILLEHFQFMPAMIEIAERQRAASRVTLIVPVTAGFDALLRRREVAEFLLRHAPAHLMFRVCFVSGKLETMLRTEYGKLQEPDSREAARKWIVENILAQATDFVSHDEGLTIYGCANDAKVREQDRLGGGRLPGSPER